jgi:hypothetical protein
MNKKLILLLFVLTTAILYSQKQENEKFKVFVDEKTGDVYWNKNLPIYLKISTQPDGDAPTINLKKQVSSKKNSFYFDTEGENFIRTRWRTNDKGKVVYPREEILYPIIADGKDPVSQIVFIYNHKYIANRTAYYDNSLRLRFECEDEVSGIDKMMYSLNSSEYKEIKETDLITPIEGSNTVKVYSVDRVGNMEKVNKWRNSRKFVVDAKAPISTYKVKGPQIENIYSPYCIFKLSANDDYSGVKHSKYKFNKSRIKKYLKEGVSFTSLKDGDNYLEYYSVDNVRNKEDDKRFDFVIDGTAPKTSFEIDKDMFLSPKNIRYVSKRSVVTIKANDERAGVDKVMVNLNNTSYNEYTAPIKLDNMRRKKNTLYYKAVDKVKNRAKPKYFSFHIDENAPMHKWYSNSVSIIREDTIYIKNSSKIRIRADEVGKIKSGIKEIKYSVNAGTDEMYNKSFVFKDRKFNKLVVNVWDHVNNLKTKEYNFCMDNDGPEIIYNFSVKELSPAAKDTTSLKSTDDIPTEINGMYPHKTYLYLAANDKIVGNDKIYYSINGGKYKEYAQPISGFKKGTQFSIKVKAIDLLGNVSYKIIKFSIKD